MLAMTLKLNEEINELKVDISKQLGFDNLINMSAEEFEMCKKIFSILDTSQGLMIRQAETISDINRKLDMLLKKVDEH